MVELTLCTRIKVSVVFVSFQVILYQLILFTPVIQLFIETKQVRILNLGEKENFFRFPPLLNNAKPRQNGRWDLGAECQHVSVQWKM